MTHWAELTEPPRQGAVMIEPDYWQELEDLHDEDPGAAISLLPGKCLFPGECCMPDLYHSPSECHTAEMMEAVADLEEQ